MCTVKKRRPINRLGEGQEGQRARERTMRSHQEESPNSCRAPEPQHTQIYTSVTHAHMHTLAGTSEKGPAKQMLSQSLHKEPQ